MMMSSVSSLTVVVRCRSASLLQHCSTRERARPEPVCPVRPLQLHQSTAARAAAEAGLGADAAAAASCHPAVPSLQSKLLHADTQTPPLYISQPQVTPEREHHNTITVDVTMEQSFTALMNQNKLRLGSCKGDNVFSCLLQKSRSTLFTCYNSPALVSAADCCCRVGQGSENQRQEPELLDQ